MVNVDIGKFYPEKEVDGVKGWYWISSDTGAWTGPKEDWEESHKDIILRYCDLSGVVIQAGGNLGMYPKLLSKLFKAVYTFEPDKYNFYTLNLNCSEENIFAFNAALGASNGFCQVKRPTMENVGMHYIDSTAANLCYTPVLMLDTIFTPNNDKKISLLMLDLEGYELAALNGALHLIQRHKPVIFAERPSVQVANMLKNMGYNLAGVSKMDGVFVHTQT